MSQPPNTPAAGATGDPPGQIASLAAVPVAMAPAISSAGMEAIAYRDALLPELVIAIQKAVGSASRKAAFSGLVVQLVGTAMSFWVLAQQVLGQRDLNELEFVTVLVLGAGLIVAGPWTGKALAASPPDPEELVQEAKSAVDARQRVEEERRRRQASM
jgi:hypothetical protein